jgi:hypothetical protein
MPYLPIFLLILFVVFLIFFIGFFLVYVILFPFPPLPPLTFLTFESVCRVYGFRDKPLPQPTYLFYHSWLWEVNLNGSDWDFAFPIYTIV